MSPQAFLVGLGAPAGAVRHHEVAIDDPTANIPNASVRDNPAPERQLEVWTAAKNVALGALIASCGTVSAEEAARAAEVLGVAERRNAGLPDAGLHNTDETRRVVVEQLRHFRPRTVILPYPVGRHPDHRIAAELARDACFLSGLQRYPAAGEPHRPFKVLYALAYREDPVAPTFVVDISEQFARKLEAIRCYASQFDGAQAAGEIFPTGQDLYSLVETQNAHYGSLIRSRYGEPFWTPETTQVDDVVALGVRSM